jgi:mono/diheme cytochrome c family protein
MPADFHRTAYDAPPTKHDRKHGSDVERVETPKAFNPVIETVRTMEGEGRGRLNTDHDAATLDANGGRRPTAARRARNEVDRRCALAAAGLALAALLPISPARAQQDLLERGAYLVETAAACGICHTTRGPDGKELPGMNLAGGRVIAERGFRAVVPNITPDSETGIGRWSDAEIATAIREGKRPDGGVIGRPMPIELYRGLSDRDLAAMVSYLRTVPPVRHAVTERSSYPTPPAPYGPPVAHVPDPPADDPVARGAYLAGPVAHCTICHTPAGPDGHPDWSRTGAGGVLFEGVWGVVLSRNITPDPEHGIGTWTDGQIIQALTQGVAADGRRLTPPMSARVDRWAKMPERDLRDLVAYLRLLPSQRQPVQGEAP